MKIPDDPFGIKVVVGGAVELAKARWLPVLAAKGEARAALIRVKGEFEVRKLENQYRVIEKAEEKLKARGADPNPVNEDVLYSILEESGRTSNDELHELWAELLAVSTDESVDTNKILMCISILRQLNPFDSKKIRELVLLIPESDYTINITSYWLRNAWKTNENDTDDDLKVGEIRCHGTLHDDNGINEHFDHNREFESWDDYAQFVLVLRNLERVGLITRLKGKKYPLSAFLEQFNFTLIGQIFLNAVGLFPRQNVVFSDIEFLDSFS